MQGAKPLSPATRSKAASTLPSVNNAFYDALGDRWYDDDTHAIALLRVESELKRGFVLETLEAAGVQPGARVLDVGCGAGFLALPLAAAGYRVKGLDLAEGALAAGARQALKLGLANPPVFQVGNALALPEDSGSFDAVLLMDFLEHVETPEVAVREAARVLRPGGVAVFHTFNRTLPAKLLAVKALELFTRDCPEHIHVHHLFIKPDELAAMGERAGLRLGRWRGLRPELGPAFFASVARRRVSPGLRFTYTRSLAIGYLGSGVKI